MNIVMIGALPPPVGGTTVAFRRLADSLVDLPHVSITIINTSRSSKSLLSSTLRAIKCIGEVLWSVRVACVVTFHSSMAGALLFGPVVHILCRICGRRWVFRGFGGQFESWYQGLGDFQKRIFNATVLRADTLLFERKSSVEFFRTVTHRPVQWYPNSRRCSTTTSPASVKVMGARRFVFVGHVKPTKGIAELIEAAAQLKCPGLVVDVYGPLQDGMNEDLFRRSPVTYRGVLDAGQVQATLEGYDVLILPTYWAGEGYPGVILEAYCAGVAVIATQWGGIPEIVTEETGILVEPRNAEQLAAAMRILIESGETLRILKGGARRKAADFDEVSWVRYFVDLCSTLAGTIKA